MAEMRDDFEDMRREALSNPPYYGPLQFAGRLVDRGAFVAEVDRFVVVERLALSGDEAEGGAAPMTVGDDAIVAWIGPAAPSVGDQVVVHYVDSRWVAAKAGGCGICEPCDIPCRNLSVSWTNVLAGNDHTALVWDGESTWESECVGMLLDVLGFKYFRFRLRCVDGHSVFSILYYPDSDNHGVLDPERTCMGEPVVYSSGAEGDCVINLDSAACAPFVLVWKVADIGGGGGTVINRTCPALVNMGFVNWTITE